MKTGIEQIVEERSRQISAEGYTPEHDDEHETNELLQAAAVYMSSSAGYIIGCEDAVWPWDAASFKASGKVRNLVKAGALIAAEIDRLQRKASVPNDALCQPASAVRHSTGVTD